MKSRTIAVESLRNGIENVKRSLIDGTERGLLQDIGFIGNASPVYDWEPCAIVDLDVCIFVREKSLAVGRWLYDVRTKLVQELAANGSDFDLRIIWGAYKDARRVVRRPTIVAHLALFTEERYRQASPFIRWAWRKYSCLLETGRFARLAPHKPTLADLVSSVHERLADIESGTAPFTEMVLPSLEEVRWTVGPGDPLFAEHCLMGALVCARNHARVLGGNEADSLNNRDFVSWYDSTVLAAPELRTILDLKTRARQEGYAEIIDYAPRFCVIYMTTLCRHLHSVLSWP
jgi:hypothetical protein